MSDIYDDFERLMIGTPLEPPVKEGLPQAELSNPIEQPQAIATTARPAISLVMIVKNEEVALPACLESVKGLVDEYVIVDTGSTDRTKEIIQEWCGVVRELPFVDFVTTKNEALKLVTGKYILFMDADERLLEGHDALRQAVVDDTEAVAGQIVEGPLPTVTCAYYRVRLWRNNGDWRFVGPGVHEVIHGPAMPVYHAGIVVHHDHAHRTPESYAARIELYVKLLTEALSKDPKDTRATFYLARTFRDAGQHLAAIQTYEHYLTSMDSGFRDEKWQAAYDLATCWKALGEYDHARLALRRAFEIDDRRAEAPCLMGDMHTQKAEWHAARNNYESAVRCAVPDNVILFVDPTKYLTYPLDQLVLVYDHLKQYDQAVQVAETLVKAAPVPDARQINNLTWVRQQHERRWLFALGHTPEPVTGDLIDRQGVGGVETTYIELPKALAARGQRIMVACRCEEEHEVDGVLFVPFNEIDCYAWFNPNVTVASRWPEMLMRAQGKRILWLQDAWFAAPPEHLWDKVDAVVVSSPWHSGYLAERTGPHISERAHIIPLGIRKAAFSGLNLEKIPHRLIYSSNPDRGLFTLIAAWPEIVKRVPDASLVITYGWEGLKTWSDDPVWQAQQDDNRKRVEMWMADTPNVRMTGRLRKADLYQHMTQAQVCAYPNNFWESFCLTALETQATGVPMVTTAMGALPTTLNRDCNILIQGDPFSEAYRVTFAEEVTGLLLDDDRRTHYAAECRKHIDQTPCDWSDIAQQWLELAWK